MAISAPVAQIARFRGNPWQLAWHLELLVVLTVLSAAAHAAESPPPWIRVDPDALAGNLPEPHGAAPSNLPPSAFTIIEPASERRSAFIHSGIVESVIVQTTNSSTRSADYPGDQIVRVLSGTITFIDEPAGRVQTLSSGEYFIVPRHWRGMWLLKNLGPEPARIFVTVEGAGWAAARSAGVAPAPADRPNLPSVTRVDLHEARSRAALLDFAAPGSPPTGNPGTYGRVIFAGHLSFLLLQAPKGATYTRSAPHCESTVRVLSGRLTLEDQRGKQGTFGPDDVLIITREFRGRLRMGSGFTGLSAVAAERAATASDAPTALGAPGAQTVPSVGVCPAM